MKGDKVGEKEFLHIAKALLPNDDHIRAWCNECDTNTPITCGLGHLYTWGRGAIGHQNLQDRDRLSDMESKGAENDRDVKSEID